MPARRVSIARSCCAVEVGDERGEYERHLAPKIGVTRCSRQALRLGEPAVRLGGAPLPLVDVAEQEQSLALDVRAVEARRGLRDLSSSSHASFSRPTIIMMSARRRRSSSWTSGMLVAKHVERPRVVPLCLVEAFSPLGATGGVRERFGGLQQRRLDRAARDLAGQAARLLEVPGDDLDELVGASRQDRHPVGEADVELRASAFRDLSVRDVPHQDVLERVLVLAFDRRDVAVLDEVPPFERLQLRMRIRRRTAVVGAEVSDGAGPEDGTDDGCVVRQRLSPPSSRSSRELIRPWTLVGTGSSPISSLRQRSASTRPRSRSIRTVSSRKSGFPPAFAISDDAKGVWASARSPRRSASSAAACSLSSVPSSIVRRRPSVPRKPGDVSASSGRVEQTIASGAAVSSGAM